MELENFGCPPSVSAHAVDTGYKEVMSIECTFNY